jgi:glycosyltransferase involved in cell wall biosynthesis
MTALDAFVALPDNYRGGCIMRVGLIISGDVETLSGQPLYARHLVAYFQGCGDSVEVFMLPRTGYTRQLIGNLSGSLAQRVRAAQLDVLLQDEMAHAALLRLNRQLRGRVSYPIISLVRRLRCAEPHSPGEGDFYRSIERRYLASVDGFICQSETTQQAVCRLLDRTELARSVVVPPGGDRFHQVLTPEIISQRAGQGQPGPLRVVFVGDVIKRKGLLILLEALLKLPSGTCQLTVVGDTNLDALHLRVVYHLLLVTQLAGVTLTGSVGDEELAAILSRSHLMAVPASYSGCGAAYLEGMGFGLPAIGATAGAASEIISDGVNGYLVPPNDPAAVAHCLMNLASNQAKLAQLSLAARETFLARPRWDENMARVREVLLEWTLQRQGSG